MPIKLRAHRWGWLDRGRADTSPARLGRTALVLAIVGCSTAGCDAATSPAPVDASAPVPIDAPGGFDTYKGLPLELARNGTPTVTPVDGVIGLVCVGMSNGSQECAEFRQRAATMYAAEIAPAVRVVNCAVSGHAIERWIDPAYDAVLWRRCIEERLPLAGIRRDQVRVIWHKAANQFTTLPSGAVRPPYPSAGSDYEVFLQDLGVFAERVTDWFPAVQAVYTSSRSYGGYANTASRGEPLSYEEGHALNTWLRSHPAVDGVWYGWGPYLWAPACGTGEANGSGICYDRADYVDDGVHPSPSGRAKVSAMLHARFLQESWYRRQN